MVRPLPAGPDGRELPPVQPGQEPPPAHLPAYEYAAANLQSSYAPPVSNGGTRYSSNAREQLGLGAGAGEVPPADGKNFSAPAFTKTYDIEAKVRRSRQQLGLRQSCLMAWRQQRLSSPEDCRAWLHPCVCRLVCMLAASPQVIAALQPAPPTTGHKQRFVFERPFNRQTKPNIIGWLLMVFYLCALVFYIYVRAAKTLNLGAKYQWCVFIS